MMIFMINNYLKEVVKLPRASEEFFCDCINETCSAWWYGVCNFEFGSQVAPCVGCVHICEHEQP